MAEYRLLPVCAVIGIGALLVGQPRWGQRRQWAVVAMTAMLSAPLILYYGSIVYLELPAVFLTLVIILRLRIWLSTSPSALRASPIWPAALLLGFTKETVAPLLGALLAARLICRWRKGDFEQLRAEVAVVLPTLLPYCLYLGLRMQTPSRPYGSQFGNVFDLSLWEQALSALVRQTGWLVPLGCIGIYAMWRQRRHLELATVAAMALAVQLFLLCDDRAWIGLSRFNLLLLPMLLLVASEGMLALMKFNRAVFAAVAVAVIGTHLAISPVLSSSRLAWHGEQEQFLPFREAFQLCLDAPEPRKLLVANCGLLSIHRLAIETLSVPMPREITTIAVFEPMSAIAANAATENYDAIVWILPVGHDAPAVLGPYRRMAILPGTTDSLAVYELAPSATAASGR